MEGQKKRSKNLTTIDFFPPFSGKPSENGLF